MDYREWLKDAIESAERSARENIDNDIRREKAYARKDAWVTALDKFDSLSSPPQASGEDNLTGHICSFCETGRIIDGKGCTMCDVFIPDNQQPMPEEDFQRLKGALKDMVETGARCKNCGGTGTTDKFRSQRNVPCTKCGGAGREAKK